MDGESREPLDCPGCRKFRSAVAALERRVVGLRELVEKLRAALDAAQRAGKRQAAPFRKADAPQPQPKKPGRKPGAQHGPHVHRIAPPPQAINERYEAPLPDSCPHCTE